MNRGNVLASPMTNRAKVGPSGTSMAPPIRPVARPRMTARTTGLTKMNCQPSRISSHVRFRKERSSSIGSRSSGLGVGRGLPVGPAAMEVDGMSWKTNRHRMNAEARKDRALK